MLGPSSSEWTTTGSSSRVAGADPVRDEVRELLGQVAGDVECQPARGHADLALLAHRAEIGGTQEGCPGLALPPVALQPALLDPQAGKAIGAGRQFPGRAVVGDGEVVGRVDDLARLATVDHVHAHRLRKEAAEELEGDRVDPGPVGEERVFGSVAQLAVRVVVDPAHHVGCGLRRRHIGAASHSLRLLDQQLVAERLRLAQVQPGFGGQGRWQHAQKRDGAEGCRRGQRGAALDRH